MADHRVPAMHGHHDHAPVLMTIPMGWKRDLIEGRVVYISPSNCLLWSLDDVAAYLLSEGTCKCGLECPLIIHQAFNFDPCTCFQNPALIDSSQVNMNQNLCNHKKKVQIVHQLAPNRNEIMKTQNHELNRMYHQNMVRGDELTTVTQMISETIPSVTTIPSLHYSLLVPQQILMSNPESMILSQQLVSPYTSISHLESSHEIKKKVRKRNKSKVKTVAAMLKMKT